jgi:hypothetical protein
MSFCRFRSAGQDIKAFGIWNQVVKDAFWILNSVVSGTFCRSPARSKSPNASVSALPHIQTLPMFFHLNCDDWNSLSAQGTASAQPSRSKAEKERNRELSQCQE